MFMVSRMVSIDLNVFVFERKSWWLRGKDYVKTLERCFRTSQQIDYLKLAGEPSFKSLSVSFKMSHESTCE